MRPRYVVLTLAILLGAAVVALGPLKGRSIEAGIGELTQLAPSVLGGGGQTVHAALPRSASVSGNASNTTRKPPEVTVSQPASRNVVEWDEYTGRFQAVEAVEVQARVSGYLTKVNFTDGQEVNAGDLLFEIDPRPFEHALEQAEAELDQAKVRVNNAKLDVERGRPLLKRNFLSQKTFDDRENVVREAEAAVKVAEARVKAAELNLSFSRVTAPISGRMGRTMVTPGNFISGGGTDDGASILTTIVSQDPIYIYFDVSQNNALKYSRLSQTDGRGADAMIGAKVGIGLPDEEGFPHPGRLDFLDNRLDQGTGTLRARAVIDNKTGLFSPGMFARVRLKGSAEYPAVMLPDEAIGTDQASRFVYVVGEDGIPERKVVKLGPLIDGLRVVRSGVDPHDWIVVRGHQRVRPGQKITPKRSPIAVSQAKESHTNSFKLP